MNITAFRRIFMEDIYVKTYSVNYIDDGNGLTNESGLKTQDFRRNQIARTPRM